MTSYEEFFAWCEAQGLNSDRLIAAAFSMTPQTVRNWRVKARQPAGTPNTKPQPWLALACRGYETARRRTGEVVPSFPPTPMAWFKLWRKHHGLTTFERTGLAFGLTRQAIHNWHKRKSLPRWLPLVCLGYEHGRTA